MGLPKGFIKKVSFIEQNIGPEKRQDFLDEIDYKGMYLPKGVDYEDIDRTFVDFVNDDVTLNIDGEEVPVMFLTITKWAEFSKTWSFSDKFKNIKMPFITVVRQPDVQVGTNQNGNWNIPGKKLYTYIKVPNNQGGRKGIDIYKIPQPTSVDLTYDVRLFCNRMKDLNLFNKIIQTTFNSRQFYITVKGHPMPIHLEKIGDESQKDDFDKRRFYVQTFEMKVLGYILDEDDFEALPTINRSNLTFTEITDNNKNIDKISYVVNNLNDITTYKFNFKPFSELLFSYTSDVNINFNNISNTINVTNIIISINGVEENNGLIITKGINVNAGDIVTIQIITNNINSNSLFNLNGNII